MPKYISPSRSAIFELWNNLHAHRHKMPLDSVSDKVLPEKLYPYPSWIVAPDHLLTGHANDAMSLVFFFCLSAEIWREAEFLCSASYRILISQTKIDFRIMISDICIQWKWLHFMQYYLFPSLRSVLLFKFIADAPRNCTYRTSSSCLFNLLHYSHNKYASSKNISFDFKLQVPSASYKSRTKFHGPETDKYLAEQICKKLEQSSEFSMRDKLLFRTLLLIAEKDKRI